LRVWFSQGWVLCQFPRSNVFSFRPALIPEKICRRANYYREKGYHSSQHRKSSRVHPGSGDGGILMRPNRCITQRVVRRGTPGWRCCPRRKTTQNRQSDHENDKRNKKESFHRELVYTQRPPSAGGSVLGPGCPSPHLPLCSCLPLHCLTPPPPSLAAPADQSSKIPLA
jgi:hypothetical protein